MQINDAKTLSLVLRAQPQVQVHSPPLLVLLGCALALVVLFALVEMMVTTGRSEPLKKVKSVSWALATDVTTPTPTQKLPPPSSVTPPRTPAALQTPEVTPQTPACVGGMKRTNHWNEFLREIGGEGLSQSEMIRAYWARKAEVEASKDAANLAECPR